MVQNLPTQPGKTLERMQQERQSPGTTSDGGHAADAPQNDTARDPRSSQAGRGDLDSSAQTTARRGAIDAPAETAGRAPPAVPGASA